MMKIVVKVDGRECKLNVKEKINDTKEINMEKCIEWGYTSIAPQRILPEGIDMYMDNGELWVSRKMMKEHASLIIDQMIIERVIRDTKEELNQITYEAGIVQFISRIYYGKDMTEEDAITTVVELHEKRRKEKIC